MRTALVGLMAMVAVAPRGFAAEDARTTEARKLSAEGHKQFQIGEYDQALQAFKSAYLARPDPAFLFDIAQCQRKLEHVAEAIDAYRAYLRNAPDTRLRAEVERLISEVEKTPGTIRVASEPPGANVRLGAADSPVLGVTPFDSPKLPPGLHRVFVDKAGFVGAAEEVRVAPGGETSVHLALAAAPPLAPAPPVTEAPPARPAGRVAKLFALGTLAGALVAGALAIYTWRTYSDLGTTSHNELVQIRDATPNANVEQSQFFGAPDCSPPPGLQGPVSQYTDDCSRGRTYANATTALSVFAAALAGGSVVLYLIGDRQARHAERDTRKSRADPWQTSLRIAPVWSPRSGGLQAAFAF
jgi:hypothetical protein